MFDKEKKRKEKKRSAVNLMIQDSFKALKGLKRFGQM
jgi:hypothetical protein